MIFFLIPFYIFLIFSKNVVAWKYNIGRNVNSDFTIVTMGRVAIIFFELGVVKKFLPKF